MNWIWWKIERTTSVNFQRKTLCLKICFLERLYDGCLELKDVDIARLENEKNILKEENKSLKKENDDLASENDWLLGLVDLYARKITIFLQNKHKPNSFLAKNVSDRKKLRKRMARKNSDSDEGMKFSNKHFFDHRFLGLSTTKKLKAGTSMARGKKRFLQRIDFQTKRQIFKQQFLADSTSPKKKAGKSTGRRNTDDESLEEDE